MTGFLPLIARIACAQSLKRAAKRCKNPAYGVSRGSAEKSAQAPKGRKNSCITAPSPPTGCLNAFFRRALAAAILSGSFLYAQDVRAPFTPVTRDELWQAVTNELRARGVPGDQLPRVEELELPAAVPAASARTLRVSMVCWNADLGRAQFQLECREPGQCLPFLAYAQLGQSTAMGSGNIAGSSCRSVARSRPTPHKAIVHAGDRATVAFRGSRLRLTALVICLERGAEGDVIRVRNQDGHVFRARVSAPALLEALPQ